jgi:hypothetical protein
MCQEMVLYKRIVSWLNRGSELSISDAKNGCKRLILKLSEVLLSEEVEGLICT